MLVSTVASAVWFQADLEIEFTEGPGSPSQIVIATELDAEDLESSISVDGTLSLLKWKNDRDSNASIPDENEPKENASVVESMTLDERRASIDDSLLHLIVLEAIAFVAILLPYPVIGRTFSWAASFMLVWIIIQIQIFAPLSVMGGFERDANEDDRGTSIIHDESDLQFDWDLQRIVYTFKYSGFDLGMIPEENRSAAIEDASAADDSSKISVEGEFEVPMSELTKELLMVLAFLHLIAGIIVAWLNLGSIETPRLLDYSEEE